MPVEIRLPQLADDMSVAKVGAWLKHEGDPVRAGEPIVEIETDKTNVEVESPASGYLQRIVVPAGSIRYELSAAGRPNRASRTRAKRCRCISCTPQRS